MTRHGLLRFLGLLAIALPAPDALADDREPDPERDILVTLEAVGAAPVSGGIGAPYRKRKRYAVSVDVQLLAAEIAADYRMLEVVRWPIRSLAVVCIVYRNRDAEGRDALIARLRADARVDSAQRLQRFDTRLSPPSDYDDTLVDLQRSLTVMSVPQAHRYSRGRGIRVAIVDSTADMRHEDLAGRVSAIHDFTDSRNVHQTEHGTAVASIIGASANNSRGIVGVAPEAEIALYVACWSEEAGAQAVCDSFTLAKALDALTTRPTDVVNLSLTGPRDALLERLLETIQRNGTIVVASRPSGDDGGAHFPAGLPGVVAVAAGETPARAVPASLHAAGLRDLYAPAEKIVVALPSNEYDFRSGSSLAAAHATGVVALLLSATPGLTRDTVIDYLHSSQRHAFDAGIRSINACEALRLADTSTRCR